MMCRLKLIIFFCLVAFACYPFACSAQLAGSTARSHVSARLISDAKSVRPGSPFRAGVELTMQEGWHTYYKDSGDAGMPTKATWTVPPGTKVGPLIWPTPQHMNDAGIATNGYTGRVVLSADVTPPSKIDSKWFKILANVKWLECKEVCIPGEAVLSLSLPMVTDKGISTGFFHQNLGLPAGMLFAFIGGFLLNLMPCVLPVISIKVMSLVNEASKSRQSILRNGLIFSGGIIGSFEILALAILALRSAGQAVGWGFQFQYPEFSIIMAAIILLLALSFFGVFSINPGTAATNIDRLASRGGMTGTFFNGVLATVLATPCTAPFLGTAMGFAFVEPAWIVLTIFLVIGLGMSLPYLLLTSNPGWMKFLPKPGDWMETFKQFMGFILLATVVWLLYVINGQLGGIGVLAVMAFLLMVAFACWFMNRLLDLRSGFMRKTIVWLCSAAIVFVAYDVFLKSILETYSTSENTLHTASQSALRSAKPASTPIDWRPYSEDALNSALVKKQTVFLDFTADWCLTCKVNEQAVLDSAAVVNKLKALHVVALKADWTNRNPDITAQIQKFGRFGVPLYVIFPATKPDQPIVLPEVITQGIVLDKLSEAGPSH